MIIGQIHLHLDEIQDLTDLIDIRNEMEERSRTRKAGVNQKSKSKSNLKPPKQASERQRTAAMFVESKEPSYSIEELRKPPGNLEKLESETRTPIAKPKSKVPSYSIEELRKPPGNLEKLESETRTPIAKPKSDPKSEAPPKPPVDSKLETAKPKRTPPPREVRSSTKKETSIKRPRSFSDPETSNKKKQKTEALPQQNSLTPSATYHKGDMVIVNLLVTEGITQFERSFLGTITSFRDKQNSMFVDCFRYDSYPPKKELVPMEKVRLATQEEQTIMLAHNKKPLEKLKISETNHASEEESLGLESSSD